MNFYALSLLSLLCIAPLQAMEAINPCGKCDPNACGDYGLEQALNCVSACEKENTSHAQEVVTFCQSRVDHLLHTTDHQVHQNNPVQDNSLPIEKKDNIVFPDACGNVDLDESHPELKLTRVIGLLERTLGEWVFKMVDESGHWGGRQMKIAPDVGEIGSGRSADEAVIKSYTPKKYRLLAFANLDTNTVHCLTQTYELR